LGAKQNRIYIKDQETLELYSCLLSSSKRVVNEKRLGRGWHHFLRSKHVKKGDRFIFSVDEAGLTLRVQTVNMN